MQRRNDLDYIAVEAVAVVLVAILALNLVSARKLDAEIEALDPR